MIQIYLANEKDFIISYRDFQDNDEQNIVKYIQMGLAENDVKIIKIRKFEVKKK